MSVSGPPLGCIATLCIAMTSTPTPELPITFVIPGNDFWRFISAYGNP
jgi:hypothetical protein